MRSLCRVCLWLCLLFFTSSLHAQNKKVIIAKKGNWITQVPFNANANPLEDQSSATYYLVIDEQENVGSQERFTHYAYKVLTTEGIQEMSDIMLDFDPAYHTLAIHEVKIIRGNQVINQLTPDIRTVQREESMDRYLYDGTNTAIIHLKDVRKGDIIEYSYTRKGYNPVYAGYFSRAMYFDYNVAVEKAFQKIIVPKSLAAALTFTRDEEVPYETLEDEKSKTYLWTFDQVQAMQQESNVPSWYEPERSVLITNYSGWNDVALWAAKLFAIRETDKQEIKTKILPAFKETDPDKFTLEAIRFVQDEVRYLGFESGLNSHKPHSPLTVYEQRFGDCKDKSLLLTSLLEAKGIEAYPMLVSTTLKDKIIYRAPSSIYFNHCVVKIVLGDKTIFIDPTISNQGGTLANYFFPDYKRGLVISEDTRELEVLPTPDSPSITEEQTFDVEKVGGAAVLSVITTYTGYDADYQRSELARNDLESLQKSYQKYYANLYPDITKAAALKVTDNRSTNELTVEEKYNIPTFWRPYNEDEVIYCEVSAQTLNNYFDVSKSNLQRKAPYALSYPVNYYHNTHLNLPQSWSITPQDDKIETDFYRFDYQVEMSDNKVSRYIHYKTKEDHVPEDRIKKFVSDHEKMANIVTYQLTYDKKLAANTDSKNYSGIIVTFLTLGFGAWMVLSLYRRYNPLPHVDRSEGLPIGGWLVLIGLGVCISPITLIISLSTDAEYYLSAGWKVWLNSKQYGIFTYSIFSHVFNLLQILFSVLMIVLFFERRSSFPLLMTIQIAASAITLVIDVIVSQYISSEEVSYKEAVRAVIGALIWIPYLHISTRVKETFVNQNEYGNPNRYRNV